MRHATARRLLPQLLDETLSRAERVRLRLHVGDCARCRRVLAELELCARLVEHLPFSVTPRAEALPGEPGLRRLARWAAPPSAYGDPRQALGGVAAAAAAGLFAGMLAFAGAARWLPAPEATPSFPAQVAFVSASAGR